MVMAMQNSIQTQSAVIGSDPSEKSASRPDKYLTFLAGGQHYAVTSRNVLEIIRLQPVTYMPGLPPFIRGVINLRGKIIPVIDMRMMFHIENPEYDSLTSIIVSQTGEYVVGFIVDTVKSVVDINEGRITRSDQLALSAADTYILGIASLDESSVILVDIPSLLEDSGAVSGEPGKPGA